MTTPTRRRSATSSVRGDLPELLEAVPTLPPQFGRTMRSLRFLPAAASDSAARLKPHLAPSPRTRLSALHPRLPSASRPRGSPPSPRSAQSTSRRATRTRLTNQASRRRSPRRRSATRLTPSPSPERRSPRLPLTPNSQPSKSIPTPPSTDCRPTSSRPRPPFVRPPLRTAPRRRRAERTFRALLLRRST